MTKNLKKSVIIFLQMTIYLKKSLEFVKNSEQVNIINNESNNNNEFNDDLNDEDESIVDEEDSESEAEEDDSIVEKNMLQDKMSDHYLDSYNVDGTPFLSSYIKFTSKTCKSKYYLNVGKHVGLFGDYSEGFMNFTK